MMLGTLGLSFPLLMKFLFCSATFCTFCFWDYYKFASSPPTESHFIFPRVDSVAICSQILGQPLTYKLGSSGCGAKTDAVSMISLQSLGTAIFCFGPKRSIENNSPQFFENHLIYNNQKILVNFFMPDAVYNDEHANKTFVHSVILILKCCGFYLKNYGTISWK